MSGSPRRKIQFSGFHILSDMDLLYRGEAVVQLEPRSVQVLRYLVEHRDRVVSKEELLEQVWPDVFTTDAVLKKAVLRARRSLGDDANTPRFIETYHGRGYRFVAAVVISSTDTAAGAATAEPSLDERAPLQGALVEVKEPKTSTDLPDYDQLVGREAESAALVAEYRRTLEGRGRPVLVTGEPGIGKTQLARHFGRWARQQGAVCIYARFFDYRGSRLAPYEIFLDLLRTALSFNGPTRSGDEQLDLRALAAARLRVKLPEELFADVETTSLPARVEGGEGDHFRAVVPISKCFARLSRQRPLVMILDDLQWADQASLDVIGYLMRTAQSEPLMLIALARTEEIAERDHPLADWLKLQANYRSYISLPLTPLDERTCRDAIAAIFGESLDGLQLPPNDVKTLQLTTGGNPYFLTEMLRLLVAEGAISYGAGQPARWRGIKDLHLPDTLVIAARAKLDRLSEEVRDIAEHASVIGDEFRVETLSLMADKPEEEVERLLEEGTRRGVLSQRGLSPGEDCRFYHTILRQVLYESLSPRRRKRMHTLAAHAIEIVYAREPDRIAGALSAHYQVAGDLVRTFNWSMRAWQASRSRWHWSEALISIERAQRAVSELDRLKQSELNRADELKLSLGMSECYCSLGRLKESESVLAKAIPLAEALDDAPSLATALLHHGLTQTGLGLHREAIRSTERALEIQKGIGDRNGTSLATLQLGTVQIAMGEYERAAQLIEQSRKDMAVDTHITARAAGLLGWARVLQGFSSEGVPLLERALDYHDRVGDVRQQAQVLRRLHWAHLTRGKFEAAIQLARRARDQFRTAGDTNGEAKMNMGIGQARIGQGLYEEGIQRLNRVLERFRVIGDAHCEAESLWLLGRAHAECGRFDEAALLLKGSLETVQQVADRDDEFRVMTDIARLKIDQADYLGGLGAAEQAIEIAEELRNRDGVGVALVERSRACLKLKRPQKALEAAERGVALLEETESGERWRAYWALASAVDGLGEKKGLRNRERSLEALRRSVELLREMREELDPSDGGRRAAVARARSGPARDLCALLRRLDLASEAQALAEEWLFDDPLTKSGQLRLVLLPKAN